MDNRKQGPDDLLRTKDVAQRLGLTPEAVRLMLATGTLKGIKVGKGLHWRVRDSDLRAYQISGTVRRSQQ